MYKIGMIGLDTSHVVQFANLLNDASDPHHVPGGCVVAAFPDGSPHFSLSAGRLEKFTDELRAKHQIRMADSIEDLPLDLDAILLESVDGSQHLAQFRRIADRRVPVFVDKPLASSLEDAREIVRIAAECAVPLMSCSALRFAEDFEAALRQCGEQLVTGRDFYGPMAFVDEMPGYFWYGIHSVEMLYRAFGPGCSRVRVLSNEIHDLIVAEWTDGRMASVRGNRMGNFHFGGALHTGQSVFSFSAKAGAKPYNASLIACIIAFIESRQSPVSVRESLEIIAFLDAANTSRENGGWAELAALLCGSLCLQRLARVGMDTCGGETFPRSCSGDFVEKVLKVVRRLAGEGGEFPWRGFSFPSGRHGKSPRRWRRLCPLRVRQSPRRVLPDWRGKIRRNFCERSCMSDRSQRADLLPSCGRDFGQSDGAFFKIGLRCRETNSGCGDGVGDRADRAARSVDLADKFL